MNLFFAVAPELQPGWFPFHPSSNQKLLFPNSPPAMAAVNLQEFDQLILACRVDGRPRARVDWFFNDVQIDTALPDGGFQTIEPVQGRSILIFDLIRFNETSMNPLLGPNSIRCSGSNFAGTIASGSVSLQGQS